MNCAQFALEPLDARKARQNSRFAIDNELRIALVGKTGVGKSSTANTICGGNYFQSGFTASGVTNVCIQKSARVHGRDILVIDTPGIFDSECDPEVVEREIKRCVHIGAPGLHAILFVMEIGRYRTDDIKAKEIFLQYFEDEMKDRVIVVFTHGDKLLKEKKGLADFLKSVPSPLQTLLEKCCYRVIMFNNEFSKQQSYEQVNGLLTMVEALKMSNDLAYYSDALFRKAEEKVQIREQEFQRKLEQEYEEKLLELESWKIEMQEKILRKKIEDLAEIRQDYEKRIRNARKEVRKEIADKDSSCTIL